MNDAAVSLRLPYPPSVNDLWKPSFRTNSRGKNYPVFTLSAQAKAYKAECGWIAKAAGIRAPMLGRVRVVASLYPARPLDWQDRMRRLGDMWDYDVQCVDIDNAVKVAIDGLKNIAFEDDRRLWSLAIERMEPDAQGARLLIAITPYARATPQPNLFEPEPLCALTSP